MISPQLVNVVEWSGSLLGLAGAYLLAFNVRISRWGWVAFIASNALLLITAAALARWGIFTMQLGFVGSSVLGIWRAFRVPPVAPVAAQPAIEPSPVYFAVNRLEVSLTEQDGELRTTFTLNPNQMAPMMVERWLSDRKLVAMPAGLDIRTPVRAGSAPTA